MSVLAASCLRGWLRKGRASRLSKSHFQPGRNLSFRFKPPSKCPSCPGYFRYCYGPSGHSPAVRCGQYLASENRLGHLDTWTDQASNGFYAPLLWEFERARFFLKSDKRRQKATKLHGTYSRACPATLALVTFARRSSGQRSFWKSTAIAGNMPRGLSNIIFQVEHIQMLLSKLG